MADVFAEYGERLPQCKRFECQDNLNSRAVHNRTYKLEISAQQILLYYITRCRHTCVMLIVSLHSLNLILPTKVEKTYHTNNTTHNNLHQNALILRLQIEKATIFLYKYEKDFVNLPRHRNSYEYKYSTHHAATH